MQPKFKVIKATHLTTLDRKLIVTSIENNLQDVQTKEKRLFIICTDDEGIVKANLLTFTHGIGIGAKKRWQSSEIQFLPTTKKANNEKF